MVGSLARIAVFASILFMVGIYGLMTNKHVELHRSVFSKPDIFESGYENIVVTPQEGVVGILVNHHLLAPNLIAEAFEVAKKSNPTTVVLLSPNHFNSGKSAVTVTDRSWRTPYGILNTNSKLARELADKGVAKIDYLPFEREHGVSGIVPFIKKTFPRAKVLPVIFKTTAKQYAVDDLARELKESGEKILVVASIDMSHYVAEEIAAEQDLETQAVLASRDLGRVWDVKIDSPQSMYALLRLTEPKAFNLLKRSSSAKIVPQVKPENNTSYITGYFR